LGLLVFLFGLSDQSGRRAVIHHQVISSYAFLLVACDGGQIFEDAILRSHQKSFFGVIYLDVEGFAVFGLFIDLRGIVPVVVE